MRDYLLANSHGLILFLILMQGCTDGTPPDQGSPTTKDSGVEVQPGQSVVSVSADQLIVAAASANAAEAVPAYQELEQNGHCPYLENSPETPVGMLAAAYGTPQADNSRIEETIRLLVGQGCDIDQYSAAGLTPAHNAVLFRQPGLLRFLVQLGADAKLRVIGIPGSEQGQRIANLDAYGLALTLQAKAPDDKVLTEITHFLKTLDEISGPSENTIKQQE